MVVPESVGEQHICFDYSIPLNFSPFQKPFGIHIWNLLTFTTLVTLFDFGFCEKLYDLWKFRIFCFGIGCWIFKLKMFVCSKYCEVHVYYKQVKSSQVDLVVTGIKIKKPSRVFIVMWLGHPVWTLLISRWESFPTSIFSSFHGISAISLCGIWI